MAITLQSILNPNFGTGKILVNDQGSGFESVGIIHRLKSFFNIGDARAKNLQTLNAIKTALLVDPRFSAANATDLQQLVDRLLDDVRIDRAIDASRIKSIVQALDGLATPGLATQDERVRLHLAAVIPPGLSAYSDKVGNIALQCVVTQKDPDISVVVGDVINRCESVINGMSDLCDRQPEEVKDFVGKHLQQLLLKSDGSLRTYDEIGELRAFCQKASRDAYGRAAARGINQYYALDSFAKPYELAAAAFLAEVRRPVNPNQFDKIIDYVQSVPLKEFADLDDVRCPPNGHAVSVVCRNFSTSVRGVSGDGLKSIFADDGNKVCDPLVRYAAKLIGLKLTSWNLGPIICQEQDVQAVEDWLEPILREALNESEPAATKPTATKAAAKD